ncbi:MAG: hypothetical protein M1832_000328 [Thelocarpon impressellum]|nr:MAG: hypothetical protein M1832_000328 [Thelocarpon impressellum]
MAASARGAHLVLAAYDSAAQHPAAEPQPRRELGWRSIDERLSADAISNPVYNVYPHPCYLEVLEGTAELLVGSEPLMRLEPGHDLVEVGPRVTYQWKAAFGHLLTREWCPKEGGYLASGDAMQPDRREYLPSSLLTPNVGGNTYFGFTPDNDPNSNPPHRPPPFTATHPFEDLDPNFSYQPDDTPCTEDISMDGGRTFAHDGGHPFQYGGHPFHHDGGGAPNNVLPFRVGSREAERDIALRYVRSRGGPFPMDTPGAPQRQGPRENDTDSEHGGADPANLDLDQQQEADALCGTREPICDQCQRMTSGDPTYQWGCNRMRYRDRAFQILAAKLTDINKPEAIDALLRANDFKWIKNELTLEAWCPYGPSLVMRAYPFSSKDSELSSETQMVHDDVSGGWRPEMRNSELIGVDPVHPVSEEVLNSYLDQLAEKYLRDHIAATCERQPNGFQSSILDIICRLAKKQIKMVLGQMHMRLIGDVLAQLETNLQRGPWVPTVIVVMLLTMVMEDLQVTLRDFVVSCMANGDHAHTHADAIHACTVIDKHFRDMMMEFQRGQKWQTRGNPLQDLDRPDLCGSDPERKFINSLRHLLRSSTSFKRAQDRPAQNVMEAYSTGEQFGASNNSRLLLELMGSFKKRPRNCRK